MAESSTPKGKKDKNKKILIGLGIVVVGIAIWLLMRRKKSSSNIFLNITNYSATNYAPLSDAQVKSELEKANALVESKGVDGAITDLQSQVATLEAQGTPESLALAKLLKDFIADLQMQKENQVKSATGGVSSGSMVGSMSGSMIGSMGGSQPMAVTANANDPQFAPLTPDQIQGQVDATNASLVTNGLPNTIQSINDEINALSGSTNPQDIAKVKLLQYLLAQLTSQSPSVVTIDTANNSYAPLTPTQIKAEVDATNASLSTNGVQSTLDTLNSRIIQLAGSTNPSDIAMSSLLQNLASQLSGLASSSGTPYGSTSSSMGLPTSMVNSMVNTMANACRYFSNATSLGGSGLSLGTNVGNAITIVLNNASQGRYMTIRALDSNGNLPIGGQTYRIKIESDIEIIGGTDTGRFTFGGDATKLTTFTYTSITPTTPIEADIVWGGARADGETQFAFKLPSWGLGTKTGNIRITISTLECVVPQPNTMGSMTTPYGSTTMSMGLPTTMTPSTMLNIPTPAPAVPSLSNPIIHTCGTYTSWYISGYNIQTAQPDPLERTGEEVILAARWGGANRVLVNVLPTNGLPSIVPFMLVKLTITITNISNTPSKIGFNIGFTNPNNSSSSTTSYGYLSSIKMFNITKEEIGTTGAVFTLSGVVPSQGGNQFFIVPDNTMIPYAEWQRYEVRVKVQTGGCVSGAVVNTPLNISTGNMLTSGSVNDLLTRPTTTTTTSPISTTTSPITTTSPTTSPIITTRV